MTETTGTTAKAGGAFINVPNTITIVRVILCLVTVPMMISPDDPMRWAAFGLTALVIWGDGLDGYFARKLNQTTKMGAILDIAGDRVVEMIYWVSFAYYHWIDLWVPVLFLVRGTFVDAMRAQAGEEGRTAFGAKTMMDTPLGKFLVASNFMRFTYAIVKAVAFCLVIAAHTNWGVSTPMVGTIAMICVYVSCVYCVLRGIPVLIEGMRYLK
jgi:CDP-diacylglycerol---glycerol-3-phosphate 3-phosphatidyltransferase